MRLWIVGLAVAMVSAACGGGGDGVVEAAQPGGSVTVALDVEPDMLNAARSVLAATAVVGSAVLAGPYRLTADLEFEPWLIDGEPELTEDPFTVTYRIRDDAVWSDGVPITARDFEFTWQTLTNPDWDIPVRDPAERVERAEILDDKTIRFTYSEPYAGWQVLFGRDGIFPAHVLEGEDFNTVWDDEITVASGPFQFSEWRRGVSITLERNPAYWDSPAHLDEIVIRFIPDTNTVPQALRGGEVDLAVVEPDHLPQLVAAGLETSAVLGVRFEFLDLRLEAVPPFVRQAMAYAIDRDGIVDTLVRSAVPDGIPLDSLVYLTGDEDYEPHFARYPYDPDRAVALLTEHGCAREPDGVFACDGQRLEYRYATVTGRERSGLKSEIIQANLAAVGIGLEVLFGDIPTVLEHLAQGRADLSSLSIHLGWEPIFRGILFGCTPSLGASNYCNEAVDDLLERGPKTIDPAERAPIYNEAGMLLAEDLPAIPLYQVPHVIAWDSRLQGVEHVDANLLAYPERWHVTD
jgi:peptide/nickel transport system substrate-binding protein